MKDDKINNLRLELMQEIKNISEDVREIKDSVLKLPDELTQRFDERYASKETELSLKRINWIVITAVIGALLALVITQNG